MCQQEYNKCFLTSKVLSLCRREVSHIRSIGDKRYVIPPFRKDSIEYPTSSAFQISWICNTADNRTPNGTIFIISLK